MHGLTILAAGARHAARVNHAAFVRQRETLNTGWMTLGEWMATHPPLARRLVQLDPTLGPRRVGLAGPLRALALLALILAPLAALGWVSATRLPAFLAQVQAEAAAGGAAANDDLPGSTIESAPTVP